VTQQQEQDFPYYRSPSSIRNETFNHRMRGLDEDEVREYLDLLADQVQATDNERAAQRGEIERLRAEVRRLEEEADDASDDISPQAVALFSQAQQVADQLVDEAVRHARDLMTSARNQQRDILQRAHEAAEEAVRRTGATQVAAPSGGYTTPVPEVEYVRTFARVAQVQLRSVLDALAEQVDRLGEVPELDRRGAELEPTSFPRPHSAQQGQPSDEAGAGSTRDESAGLSIYEQVWSIQGRAVE
jgi:cell division initiation protein